jgi:hypothetical protein
MPKIGPKMTQAQLYKLRGKELPDGRQKALALPGGTSDAKLKEPKTGYKKNRLLAKKIKDLRNTLKGNDADGTPQFVLGWRMYPNKDSARWKGAAHTCGCGCGCG